MSGKNEKKQDLCDIVLKNIVQEKVKGIDLKTCRTLLEILTILKAMKWKSLTDLEDLITGERPEVMQGLVNSTGSKPDENIKKTIS